MKRELRNMLKAKKSLLDDFNIKWDEAIEEKFKLELEAKPDRDPQIILDQICRPYIMRKLGA